MTSTRAVVFAVALVCSPGAARADTALNVGIVEVASVPEVEHVGTYGYIGISAAVPWRDIVFVPSLGVALSPELRRWGVVGTGLIDVPVTHRLGIDVIVTLTHDQSGTAWSDSMLFAGGGVGVSISLQSAVLSPSVIVARGINTNGVSVIPGFNLSYAP